MANLPLYVALRRTIDAALMTPELLLEHLRWMVRQEAQGTIFASGPFDQPGRPRGAVGGLTVLRVDDEDAARRLLADDPFIRSGAVDFELRRWILMEGSPDLQVRLSGQPAADR
ncbi:hypothetical protein JI739_21885 [Ramlibacter sp. AW1]|uniref:YCII-related domain-containing protein n=2 Tax=Ramlibacter aurantiacus TaxID=2801330 RepID=A0A936ZT50_9BURK|nr:hypothetical protein [Ramlibacter aurantiacus]